MERLNLKRKMMGGVVRSEDEISVVAVTTKITSHMGVGLINLISLVQKWMCRADSMCISYDNFRWFAPQ